MRELEGRLSRCRPCTAGPDADPDREVAEEDDLVARVEGPAELHELRVVRPDQRDAGRVAVDVREARETRTTRPAKKPCGPVHARVAAVADLGPEAGELVGHARERKVADRRQVQRVVRRGQVLQVGAVAADDEAERVALHGDGLEAHALVELLGARRPRAPRHAARATRGAPRAHSEAAAHEHA